MFCHPLPDPAAAAALSFSPAPPRRLPDPVDGQRPTSSGAPQHPGSLRSPRRDTSAIGERAG
eukprot:10496876-Lingulodinium_polyedra.AAC.1